MSDLEKALLQKLFDNQPIEMTEENRNALLKMHAFCYVQRELLKDPDRETFTITATGRMALHHRITGS